jgi:hypothetical protein
VLYIISIIKEESLVASRYRTVKVIKKRLQVKMYHLPVGEKLSLT